MLKNYPTLPLKVINLGMLNFREKDRYWSLAKVYPLHFGNFLPCESFSPRKFLFSKF